MRQRKSIILGSVAILFVAIIGILFVQHSNSKAVTDIESSITANAAGQTKSPFSFNESATNGWYKGPANEESLAVFGKNSKSKEVNETYFAYIHHKDDGVNETEWLHELESRDHSDYIFVLGKVLPATLQTSSGPIKYQLHTYTNQLKEGKVKSDYGLNDAEVHGYIPYNGGYFLVQGYTTPANLITEAIDAIEAFSFNPSK